MREEATYGKGQEYYLLQTCIYCVWNWPKIKFTFQGEKYMKWTMLILQYL